MKPKIQYRIATPEDAESILEIYTPVINTTAISFEETPPSVADMAKRIEKILEKHPWIVAVDKNEKILGYAYASPYRDRAAYKWASEVSIYIRDTHQKLGLGKSLYEKLFHIMKKQNIYKSYALIALPNTGSIALHEKMGFQYLCIFKNVGYKLGKWHDVGWWEKTLSRSANAPSEPIKFSDLKNTLLF
jgi:L-amino acid N-acyltransferase YncA